MNVLHLLWPWPIDDAQHPSGGNIYDAHVRDGLRARGWTCSEHVVSGTWPQPASAALQELAQVLDGLADGATALIDGVMAPAGVAAIVRAARRLRIVILLHMPFGEAFPELAGAEREALAASALVVTTSAWTRAWIAARLGAPEARLRVATPGADPAPLLSGRAAGECLLCVANVSYLKGHDVLVAALGSIRRLAWHCTCVGAPSGDRPFDRELHDAARALGIADRIRWTGALSGADLRAAWAGADVLVLASRRESYGMVVVEALAHGLPVIASRVGGVAEALGATAGGEVPGILVDPGSPSALAGALRAWLGDAALRSRLRAAAAARRREPHGWCEAVTLIDGALREVQRGVDSLA